MRNRYAFAAALILAGGFYFSYDRLTRPYFLQDLHHLVHGYISRVSVSVADGLLGYPKAKPLCYANEKKLAQRIDTPLPWVSASIQLAFAKYPDVSVSAVRRTFTESDPRDNLVLYHITKNAVSATCRNSKMNGGCNVAVEYYRALFGDLARRLNIKELTVLLRLADFSSTDYSGKNLADIAPILAVTTDLRRHIDKDAVLIPDYQNLLSWARNRPLLDRVMAKYPWKAKKEIVFWRGGPADVSGYRHKIVDLSARLRRDPIDAQFTYGPKATAGFLKPENHVPYKYQLTIDGHTAAWERPVWQLYSNCVVLKQESPYVQWFYHVLRPGVHFVEVPNDPGLLLKALRTYADIELQRVAEQSHKFARDNLSIEDMIAHIALVLKAYAQKQVSPPNL